MEQPKRKGKVGTLSNEVRQFILEHQAEYTPEQLAEKTGIKPQTIKNLLDSHTAISPVNDGWRSHLKRSTAWKQIRDEFNDLELDYFLEKYSELMTQLSSDSEILPTENTQVINIIKIEILQSRTLKSKRELIRAIERQERRLELMGEVDLLDDARRIEIQELERSVAAARAAEQGKTKEWNDLNTQHIKMNEELKGSRAQRVKDIASGKISFTGLVKELMSKDKQEKEARSIELFKLSMQKEERRLGRGHRYIDNTVDLPILTAENLDILEKENKEQEDKENE